MSGKSVERDSGGPVALTVLAIIAALTVLWWALALWPLPSAAPEWLERARAVCFGSVRNGLPDSSGWLALVLQPALMFGILFVVWGQSVRAGLRWLASATPGRIALLTFGLLLLLGAVAAGTRVRQEFRGQADRRSSNELPATSHERLQREAPDLSLTDQFGGTLSLADFLGRPVLLTFAFGHCETVCPLVVKDALFAQRRMESASPVLLVVTLDPWRDTPSRLQHLARAWELGDDAHVLGGSVQAVNEVLDAWNVPRSRDQLTGEITHPALVYLLDANGKIAFATTGGRQTILELGRRLQDIS